MAQNQIQDSNATRAIKLAHRRKATFIAFLIFIVLFLIAFVIYHQMKSSREAAIASEYANISDIYNQENLAYQQQIEAQKAQEAKDNKNPSEAKTTLPKIDPDFSASMSKFQSFALKYPQDPYGWQAAIRSSTYFIAKAKFDEAQKVLEAVLPYTSYENLVQIKLRTSLAGIYAGENKTDSALEQLNIVEKLPHNPMVNQTRYFKAQILYAAGQKEEAKKVLNLIISTPAESAPSSPQFQSTDITHAAKVLLNKIGL